MTTWNILSVAELKSLLSEELQRNDRLTMRSRYAAHLSLETRTPTTPICGLQYLVKTKKSISNNSSISYSACDLPLRARAMWTRRTKNSTNTRKLAQTYVPAFWKKTENPGLWELLIQQLRETSL